MTSHPPGFLLATFPNADASPQPALDPAPFARVFAETKCVQVPNLFEDEVAAALEMVLLSLPWRLVLQNDRHENVFLTQEQLRAMPPQEMQKMLAGQKTRAANNSAFIYFTYPMIEAVQQRWDANHPIHQLTQFLNSPEFIAFAKELISYPGLTKIDAQANNYSAGHYLTRHIDDGIKKSAAPRARSVSRAVGNRIGAVC